MKAISDFVKAWDSLPVGKHSPQAIQEWLNNPEMIRAVKELKRLNEDSEQLQKIVLSPQTINRAIFMLEDAGDYLATIYRKYNIPVTEQGLDPVKLREAARNLEDS